MHKRERGREGEREKKKKEEEEEAEEGKKGGREEGRKRNFCVCFLGGQYWGLIRC
jgi:hypothetical protein